LGAVIPRLDVVFVARVERSDLQRPYEIDFMTCLRPEVAG
jgi:hypothetical protein